MNKRYGLGGFYEQIKTFQGCGNRLDGTKENISLLDILSAAGNRCLNPFNTKMQPVGDRNSAHLTFILVVKSLCAQI